MLVLRDQLRPEEYKEFPFIQPPHEIIDNRSASDDFDGLQYITMLDRYSLRDNTLKTLKVGDLVVTTVKDDPKYPTQGYGTVKEIRGDKLIVDIAYPESVYDDSGSLVDLKNFEADKKKTFKPLELYWEQIAYRNAKAIAEIETDEKDKQYWFERFFWMLKHKYYVPAGRILYGTGSGTNVTLYNCFMLPFVGDSRKKIIEHIGKATEIMARGGGVGSNISCLRPAKTKVWGVNGASSGAVSWANYLSQLTHLIEQGGSRRGAQMIALADWHPDVIEFAMCKIQNPYILDKISKESDDPFIRNKAEHFLVRDKKGNPVAVRDKEYMTGANISVLVSDDFMKAVENNEDWHLRFPDIENMNEEERKHYDEEWEKIGDVREWEKRGLKTKTYYTLKARELWHLINLCARYSAEPGVIFIDQANKKSNSWYYPNGKGKLIGTNPCGEQPLTGFGVCNLGAVNLSLMYDEKTNDINWDLLKEVLHVSQRFSDNVIDANHYFFSENEEMAKGERRIGKGVMGLADLFIKMKIPYGSEEMLKKTDELFEFIAVESYLASANLAEEKGSFPYFDKEKFLESGYMKTMPEKVRKAVQQKGIRNVTSLTVAPTGSTGTMMGVATGLEPYFAFSYYRSGRLGKYIKVNTKIAQEYFDNHPEATELPDYYVSAMDIGAMEHVKVQGVIQRWIDSAISKTCNAPSDFTVDENKELYMEAWKLGCKGITVYVDGSRDSQVLSLNEEDNEFKEEQNDTQDEQNTPKTNEELTENTLSCRISFDEQGNMIKECS